MFRHSEKPVPKNARASRLWLPGQKFKYTVSPQKEQSSTKPFDLVVIRWQS
jgi:hypothetical protein